MDLKRIGCCSRFILGGLMMMLQMMVDGGGLGINYGQIANNLPSPEKVVPLVRSIGASKLKLYDADPRVLKAFANTGVEFVVGIGNEYLSQMSMNPDKALSWVKENVHSHLLAATRITCITVGNEVLTLNDTDLSTSLLPAMRNVHAALVKLNLDKQVTVTTAHKLSLLHTSYPPSAGKFLPDLTQQFITPILDFHLKTASPFLINAYPFFAYKANPRQVPLDFVMFQPNSGFVDPLTRLHYDNMLFAQIDAVYSALASLGYKTVPVHISETGWPSKGDEDEAGATPENANKYNGNLINKLLTMTSQKKMLATPLRPNYDLNIYVFALFNENMKPGPASERNYGLFRPDGQPAYPLITSAALVGKAAPAASAGGGVVNYTNSGGDQGTRSSSTGYLSISSATLTVMQGKLRTFFILSVVGFIALAV